MNKYVFTFLLGVFCALSVRADSFLTAQSFPKTFEDLSFFDRIELKTADYELYRPVYENGICVKNCAYAGLNIEYETEKSETDTQNAIEQSKKYEQMVQLPVNTQTIVNTVEGFASGRPTCKNRNNAIPVGQRAPWGEPVAGYPRISSPYGPRTLHGKQSFHDGIDYAIIVGTPVYATADGYVVRVINDGTCGLGLRIKHGDGTQTIYCHLSKQMVASGENVGAGCQVGLSGNTGHSTGPHLHYGMRDANGNKINPSEYTKRAK